MTRIILIDLNVGSQWHSRDDHIAGKYNTISELLPTLLHSDILDLLKLMVNGVAGDNGLNVQSHATVECRNDNVSADGRCSVAAAARETPHR